jgi:hypothetical protein
MNMSPTTVAIPSAWMVSASGQPHDSSTHIANGEFASHSSTFTLPDRYVHRYDLRQPAFRSSALFR